MLKIEDYQSIFHEVKNAISVIGCSLQLIEKKHPEVKEFAYWNDTLCDIGNLRNLVLDVSSTKLCENPQIKAVNLCDFLSEIRSAAHALLSEDATITFDIPFDMPTCYFDPIRIRHALINLIKNASEAIQPDGQLTIRTIVRDELLIFEVCDNGCGMSPETLNQIFTPFYSSKTDGTGLGLPITKGIAESHHGSLKVASVLGEGTTFTMELPLKPIQNGKSDLVSEAS